MALELKEYEVEFDNGEKLVVEALDEDDAKIEAGNHVLRNCEDWGSIIFVTLL